MESYQPKSNLFKSFKYGFAGLHSATRTETNWKIGIVEALFVIGAGLYFNISRNDWIAVLITIAIVLNAELTNSAIEQMVDNFVQKEHPGAKLAKDISAGAVVILILAAAIIGIIIFYPYILKITSPV